jgi:hypothetical protein
VRGVNPAQLVTGQHILERPGGELRDTFRKAIQTSGMFLENLPRFFY